MIEFRLRSKTSKEELEQKKGKILTDEDYNVLLTRACRVLKPDGKPLCIYLPGGVHASMDECYPVLQKMKLGTDNRGLASGTVRVNVGGKRSRTMPIQSGILGGMDPQPQRSYCRLTAYTRQHLDQWQGIFPLLAHMAAHFEIEVPDRFKNQMEAVDKTPEDWIVPGTPFTTITVNNSYSTGVHTDKGDLDAGFSCLAVGRRGDYSGGILTFPEYRVAANLRHGDLILMDAHEWHGNTAMVCPCGNRLNTGPCQECGSERISVVAYYRTKMQKCGTLEEEEIKAGKKLATV